jgi:hypothetical protein
MQVDSGRNMALIQHIERLTIPGSTAYLVWVPDQDQGLLSEGYKSPDY